MPSRPTVAISTVTVSSTSATTDKTQVNGKYTWVIVASVS